MIAGKVNGEASTPCLSYFASTNPGKGNMSNGDDGPSPRFGKERPEYSGGPGNLVAAVGGCGAVIG